MSLEGRPASELIGELVEDFVKQYDFRGKTR